MPKEIRWKLLYKSFGAVLALGFAYLLGFSFFGGLVYFAALVALYRSEFSSRQVRVSFWLLGVLALLGLYAVTFSLPSFFAASIIKLLILLGFGALLYCVLVDLNHVLAERLLWYRLLHSLILFFTFVEFFFFAPARESESFFPLFFWLVGIFFVVALLFREAFSFLGVAVSRSLRLASVSFGLLAAEVSALAFFLPLGFLNAGAFLAVVFILLRDALSMHFEGSLSFSFILKELTFFAVFASILFAATPWLLP